MMQEYWLMPLCGFLFDTTLAAASLVFSGVVEALSEDPLGALPSRRHDSRILPSGSTAAFMRSRTAARTSIGRRPPTCAQFYYDTVNFDQGALKLAIDFAGADHILAGSDYPHQIGSIPSMLDAIAKLPVTDEQREGIRWRQRGAAAGAWRGWQER